MAPRQAVLLAFAALAFVAGQLTEAAEVCTQENGPVRCSQCSKGADSNILAGLPRQSASGPVSNNLGDYKTTWTAIGQNCIAKPEAECPGDNAGTTPGGGDPEALGSYEESLGAYVGVAVFFAFGTAAGLLLCCLGRYCCCCRVKASCCNGGAGCCCGRYPTRRGRYCPCKCLGYTQDADGNLAYSKVEVWGTRFYMWVYCIFVLAWILQGNAGGNHGLTTAMKAWVSSPDGVAEVVYKTADPVEGFLVNIASDTVSPLLGDLAELFRDAVDFDVVETQLGCVINKIENLPDIDVFIKFLDDLDGSFTGIRNAITDIQGSINQIKQQKNVVAARAYDLTNVAGNVSAKIDSVVPSVDNTAAAIGGMVAFIDDLLNNDTGIQAMLRDLNGLGNLPTSSTRNDASTKVTALQTGGSNSAAYGQSDLDQLRTVLGTVQSSYHSLPDYGVTANRMDAFNARILLANYQDTLGIMIRSVNSTVGTLASLQGTAVTLNTTINALFAAVRAFDLSNMTNGLTSMTGVLDGIDFSPVLLEIAKVRSLPAVLPCMVTMAREINGLNDTVLELPPVLNIITDLADTLNETLVPALKNLDIVEEQEDKFKQQKADANVTGQIKDVQKMETEVKGKMDDVDVSTILADLQKMEGDVVLNITILDDIKTFNTTMNNNLLNASDINNLRTFETTKDTLVAALDTVVADLAKFNQGSCSGDTTIYCDNDAGCSGHGTCANKRVQRCVVASGTKVVGDTCNNDVDCTDAGGVKRCMVDDTRYTTLSGLIQNAAAPGGIADLSSSLSDTGADGGFDTSSFNTSIADAKKAMGDVDTSSFTSDVDGVTGGLDDFDVGDAEKQFDDLRNVITNAQNEFGNSTKTIKDLNGTLDSVDGQIQLLRDAKQMIRALRDLLHDQIPLQTARLTKPKLQAIANQKGMGEVLFEITDVIDDLTDFLNDSTPMFGEISTNLTAQVADIGEQLDLLSHDRHRAHGGLYFLTALSDPDSKSYVTFEEGKGGSLNEDASGNKYSGDRQCMTDKCLDKYIDALNSQSMDEATDGGLPLPMSRTDLMGLPYLIPALIMLLGLLASMCFLCGNKCGWCCSCCSCFWIGCQMPVIFYFAGLFFVFPMVIGDFCYGFENAGYRIIEASGDFMCTEQLGGKGTIDACDVVLPPPINTTITLDVLGLYAGLMGGQCAVDPFKPAFDSLADNIKGMPVSFLDDMLNGTDGGVGGLKLRQPFKNVLKNAGSNAGISMGTLVNGLGTAFGCESLSNAYSGFKDALCCETLSAMYWIVASWYLIGWTYLWCGCGASVMGLKRFNGKLWGAHFKADEQNADKVVEMGAVGGYDDDGSDGGMVETHVPLAPAGPPPPAGEGGVGGYGDGEDPFAVAGIGSGEAMPGAATDYDNAHAYAAADPGRMSEPTPPPKQAAW